MKRIVFWLLTIAFTFILGLAATLIHFKDSSSKVETLPEIASSESETGKIEGSALTFCELVKNPEKYDGQTVSLAAKINFGIEGAYFSDVRCGLDYAAIVRAENPEVWKEIDKARKRKKGEFWDSALNLTVAGKFKNEVYNDQCCVTTPFQFEILKVEKASKVK